MGKKSPSPPPAPDPVKTAEARGAANREAALASLETSMIDQITPYGSLVYRPAGSSGTGAPAGSPQRVFDQAGYDAAVANQAAAATRQLIAEPEFEKGFQRGAWAAEQRRKGFEEDPTTGQFYRPAQPVTAVNRDDFYRTVPGGASAFTASGNPRYEAVQTLSPDQQRILDLEEQAQISFGNIANNQLGQVNERLSSPLDFSVLGDVPEANADVRNQYRDALIDRQQPFIDRDRAALETRLANQGITIGSDAYNAEMDRFQRGLNDFRLGAEAAAGSEMANLYGLESNAYDRRANQLLQERQVPLNELIAMMSSTQVQNPNFVPTPQVNIAPAPIDDATFGAYNAASNNYAQQVAAQNARTQGLFSLLGAGVQAAPFFFSDRRLKTDIERIGTLPSGLGLYQYRYVWGGPVQTGVMADEVKAWKPEAVITVGGYDAVNYAEVF